MSEDYVPGSTDPEYDYTADDRKDTSKVPFGGADEIGDDVEISTEFRSDTTADDIEKGSFRPVPIGVHILYVKEVKWADVTEKTTGVHKKVYVKQPNGTTRAMFFDTRQVKVVFAVPGDENCTCMDFFVLPPPNKDQLEAYEFGFAENKEEEAKKSPREKGGFHAKKLMHFLARLGFQNDTNGRLPKEAGRLANWVRYPGTNIHRFIKLEIVPPNANNAKYQDKDGNMVERKQYPQIKMFSFQFVNPPPAVAIAQREQRDAANAAVNKPADLPVDSKPADSKSAAEPPVEHHDDPSETKPERGRGRKQKATSHV